MSKLSIITLAFLLAIASARHAPKDIVDEINGSQKYWKAEHNAITNQGTGYMKRLMGSLFPKNLDSMERKQIERTQEVPDEFDSRNQWPDCPSISAIRDQGHCGSCWAVAAASAASDRLCISSKSASSFNFSSQDLMSCCLYCSILGGCNGGFSDRAWNFIKVFGLVSGGDYDSNEGCRPYEIPPTKSDNEFIPTPLCYLACPNENFTTGYFKDKHHAKKTFVVDNTVAAIQNEIYTNGPVEASFKVYDDFMHYKSGVYVKTSDNYLGGHAVRMIGWGTDSQSKLDYWLIANSWNATWGNNGLFKIRRGTNECGIEDYVVAGTF